MQKILSIQELYKNYGKVRAVSGLSLEVEAGSVFGVLGPNGSGKTTTLGILLDVVRQDAGSYQWFGQAPSAGSRKKLGAILETPVFYPYLSATDNLKIVAQIKEVPYRRIDEVLQWVGLNERRQDAFKTYSLGMKQRLAIAAALLCDPAVLILDEPTNGLDPQGIAEIRELIIRIAGEGKTIILASHLLDEVQKVCTHFAVLNKGRLVYTGSVEEALSGNDTVEVAADNMPQLKQLTADFPFTREILHENGILRIKLAPDKSSLDLNRFLVEHGVVVSHLKQQKQSLEKQFLELLAASSHA